MTAFSSTIRNTVLVFGPEPTEKWAVTGTSGTTPLIWGTDKWAYGTVGLPTDFTKGIFNSFPVTNMVGKLFTKGIVDNTFTVSNTITGKNILKGIFNTSAINTDIYRRMIHLIEDATAITTTISRGMFISLYGDIPVTNVVGKGFTKNIVDNTFTVSNGITGKYVLKGVFNSQEVTNSVGKNMMHFYDNSTVMTTAIGKNVSKGIVDDFALTEEISRSMKYNLTLSYGNDVFMLTNPTIYQMRDGYYVTNGGISNVVSWPRATIYTSTTRGPLTWSNSTATTTTWV